MFWQDIKHKWHIIVVFTWAENVIQAANFPDDRWNTLTVFFFILLSDASGLSHPKMYFLQERPDKVWIFYYKSSSSFSASFKAEFLLFRHIQCENARVTTENRQKVSTVSHSSGCIVVAPMKFDLVRVSKTELSLNHKSDLALIMFLAPYLSEYRPQKAQNT